MHMQMSYNGLVAVAEYDECDDIVAERLLSQFQPDIRLVWVDPRMPSTMTILGSQSTLNFMSLHSESTRP